MSSELEQSDVQILNRIVEHANSQHLRESRVNQKSSFNILRMLSSFKQLTPEFKLRKDNIYNWIIFITKQYNPQTMRQWLNAISEIACTNSQIQSRKTSIYEHHRKRVNTTIHEFYRDCEHTNQSKISSRHSTTRLNSNWDLCREKNESYNYG